MTYQTFDSIYNYILLYLAVMSCIFVFSLLATSFPRHPAYKRYQQARYSIIIGLSLTSVLFFCHWFFHLRDLSTYYSIALNLGVVYLCLSFFIMAFISIIRKENFRAKHVERNLMPSIVCIIALWGGGFGERTIRIGVVVIVATIFIAEIVRLYLVFRKALKRYVKIQKQQPFANIIVLKMSRFIYWGLAVGTMMIGIILFDKKIAILMLFGIAVFFFYLFVSILNHAMHFEKEVSTQKPASSLTQQSKNKKLEKDLLKWIQDKQYTKSKLTLNNVAQQLNTNRTYLSQYINTELNMSFGDWLLQLRLNEAKQMFSEKPSLRITEVALACGFSSASNFSHLFAELEGMTPQQWRKSLR